MPKFCHAKAAGEVQGVQPRKVLIMVLLCAKLGNCSTAQGEVDPGFDAQAVVTESQCFQSRLKPQWICTA